MKKLHPIKTEHTFSMPCSYQTTITLGKKDLPMVYRCPLHGEEYLLELPSQGRNASEQIRSYLRKAVEIAVSEVELLARKILAEHPELKEFVMGNGGAHFTRVVGRSVQVEDESYMKELDRLIVTWDLVLNITGEPMRFTATGQKRTNW
jgi:hypothetical protein